MQQTLKTATTDDFTCMHCLQPIRCGTEYIEQDSIKFHFTCQHTLADARRPQVIHGGRRRIVFHSPVFGRGGHKERENIISLMRPHCLFVVAQH